MKNKFGKAGLIVGERLRQLVDERLRQQNYENLNFSDVSPKEVFAALNGPKNIYHNPCPIHFPLHATAGKTIEELIEEIKRKDTIRNLIIHAVTEEAEECEQMDEKETLEYLRSGSKFNSEDAVEICLCLDLFNDDFTQDILLKNFNAQQQQKKIFSEIGTLDATETKRKI